MKKQQHKPNTNKIDQDGFLNDPNAMDPTSQAFDDSLRSLDKLTILASKGDDKAIEHLHRITCNLAKELNTNHLEKAKGYGAWPVLLSANRDARIEQTDKALRLNIGGTQAARRGRPSNLGYESEKGFAITNLERLAEARNILLMLRFGETDQHLDDQTKSAFVALTEIENHNDNLLTSIATLPQYSATTREEWIDVIVEVMKANPKLVPETRKNSSKKIHHPPEGLKKNILPFVEYRGGQMKKSLKRALKDIDAIPKYTGQ